MIKRMLLLTSLFLAANPIFAGPGQDLAKLKKEITKLITEVKDLSETIESGEKSFIDNESGHSNMSKLEQETAEIHEELENPASDDIAQQIQLMESMLVRLKLSLLSIKSKLR